MKQKWPIAGIDYFVGIQMVRIFRMARIKTQNILKILASWVS